MSGIKKNDMSEKSKKGFQTINRDATKIRMRKGEIRTN